MDKESPAVRKYLAQRADLIGRSACQYGLQASAGTDVTSDILFLQKRDRIVDIDRIGCIWTRMKTASA